MEQNISYYAHEGMLARMERVNHRQFVVIIILIVCLVASNLAWVLYETSFEEVTVTQENTDGFNNYIGNDGDIVNGETDNQNP